jgi:phage gpG-like protein
MAIKLTGDFARLEHRINLLAKPQEALLAASRAMADESLTLVNECFAQETDPYGKAWAPLLLRSGKILQDRGGMAASWHRVRADKRGFRIGNSKIYAKWHQSGTGIYGPHHTPIVPVTAKALAFGFRSGTQVFGRRGKRLKRPKAVMGKIVVRSVKGAPARKMVPDPGPVPARWKSRLFRAAKDAIGVYLST